MISRKPANIFCFPKHLEDVFIVKFLIFLDVFKTYLQDVFQRDLQDVLSWRRRLANTSSRRLHQDEYLLGMTFPHLNWIRRSSRRSEVLSHLQNQVIKRIQQTAPYNFIKSSLWITCKRKATVAFSRKLSKWLR